LARSRNIKLDKFDFETDTKQKFDFRPIGVEDEILDATAKAFGFHVHGRSAILGDTCVAHYLDALRTMDEKILTLLDIKWGKKKSKENKNKNKIKKEPK
jgi:hypothetical protein